jgi:hypothetical protein
MRCTYFLIENTSHRNSPVGARTNTKSLLITKPIYIIQHPRHLIRPTRTGMRNTSNRKTTSVLLIPHTNRLIANTGNHRGKTTLGKT